MRAERDPCEPLTGRGTHRAVGNAAVGNAPQPRANEAVRSRWSRQTVLDPAGKPGRALTPRLRLLPAGRGIRTHSWQAHTSAAATGSSRLSWFLALSFCP